MSVATARRSSAKSVASKTARPAKPAAIAKATLLFEIIQTFDMGDTHLQSVTEFWSGKPKGVESYEDPTRPGVFVTTKLYCPLDKVYFSPDASLNPQPQATA